MDCCWIILPTGSEGTSAPSLNPISRLYWSAPCNDVCPLPTVQILYIQNIFFHLSFVMCFSYILFFFPCHILHLRFLLYVCQGQIQPSPLSDLLLREDPIQVKACFNAFLAESFCTSHCVMCANAQHPPSASPQCFSCCRHTHISAVFSPLTSSLRLFISSSFPHCLSFCCTLAAFFIVYICCLDILACLHPPLHPPPIYKSQLRYWFKDLQLIFWLAAL